MRTLRDIVTDILYEVDWIDTRTFDAYYEIAARMEKAGWDYELIEKLLRDVAKASHSECR